MPSTPRLLAWFINAAMVLAVLAPALGAALYAAVTIDSDWLLATIVGWGGALLSIAVADSCVNVAVNASMKADRLDGRR